MKIHKTIGLKEDGSFDQIEIDLEEYREACAYHYRDSEEFFSLFLDKKHLGYSCGIFDCPNETLEQAMFNKYAEFCRMLPSHSEVLEVGSGFGGLSRQLANWGHDVTAYNISQTQHDYCLSKSHLRATYHNKCWTEIEGMFDAIVSDEFIVHVPDEGRLDFFKKMRSHIKDDGVFVLKNLSITKSENECNGSANLANNKIFGNVGRYPTYHETLKNADDAGFARIESITIPIDNYIKTAAAWQHRLCENADQLKEMNPELYRDCKLMFAIYQKMFKKDILSVEITKFKAV
jgi:cyclopropane-fatty-acyl-phospholipid synthase